MRSAFAALALALCAVSALAGNITEVVVYADRAWNCDGSSPPCPTCSKRVPSGSWQNPYGCAPFVAHALAAGGFVDATPCGGMDEYGAVNYKGTTYNLNVVAKQDPNCGGGLCLADYLLARGWTKTKTVSAGTFCAVVGSDGPYTHTVIGVGDGIVDAHNMAQHHAPISGYTTNLCLNPPSSEVEDAEAVKALRGSS